MNSSRHFKKLGGEEEFGVLRRRESCELGGPGPPEIGSDLFYLVNNECLFYLKPF